MAKVCAVDVVGRWSPMVSKPAISLLWGAGE